MSEFALSEELQPGQVLVTGGESGYAQAIEARPELHEQIGKINRDNSLIRLAERQSIPDVTLGANWIGTSSSGISPVANGDDESSTNYIEEQKPGVFPKTLRNMWIAVAIFSPLISFLSFAVLPMAEIVEYKNALLSMMGHHSVIQITGADDQDFLP